MKTFWLSFVDVDEARARFLGVAVVDVTVEQAAEMLADIAVRFPQHEPGAEWLAAAISVAWATGCNPGGQVGAVEMPPNDALTLAAPRNQLLSREDLHALGLPAGGH
jgi:hypothetical protein